MAVKGEMTQEQMDIVLRFLGRQGMTAEIVSPTRLGTATLGNFQEFASQFSDKALKGKLGTRTFYALARASNEPESIEIDPRFRDLVVWPELDLDKAQQLSRDNFLQSIPNFGPRSEEFLRAFLDKREQEIAASEQEAPSS